MEFNIDECSGTIEHYEHDVVVNIVMKENVDNNRLEYLAAAPADYRQSFSGSGMPFANANMAFDKTPNQGIAVVETDGRTSIRLLMPNSYYSDFNGTLETPYVFLHYTSIGKQRECLIRLQRAIPYRSLTYPSMRKGPNFYGHGWSQPVRSQERILRDAGYPDKNKEAGDFWGLKPPL
jgi:hypothetical protein